MQAWITHRKQTTTLGRSGSLDNRYILDDDRWVILRGLTASNRSLRYPAGGSLRVRSLLRLYVILLSDGHHRRSSKTEAPASMTRPMPAHAMNRTIAAQNWSLVDLIGRNLPDGN